jgi:hypothetical protein
VRSQGSRPWALRWNAVGGLGRVNAFGFRVMMCRQNERLRRRPSCTKATFQDEGAHFVLSRSSKRTKALIGNYEKMALKTLANRPMRSFPPWRSCTHKGLSRFHRPLWGKSTCARKVRKEGAQGRDRFLCVKTGVSREGEGRGFRRTAESMLLPILPRRVCNSRFGRKFVSGRRTPGSVSHPTP